MIKTVVALQINLNILSTSYKMMNSIRKKYQTISYSSKDRKTDAVDLILVFLSRVSTNFRCPHRERKKRRKKAPIGLIICCFALY